MAVLSNIQESSSKSSGNGQLEQEGLARTKAEKEKEKKEELHRKKVNWWLSKAVSALAIVYLIWGAIAPANQRPKEITNQDIALAFVVLLFNSGLLDKLAGFSVSASGVEAKFDKLEEAIGQNQEDIAELQKKQIEDLVKLQNFLASAVLDGYEYITLYNLNRENVEGLMYDYNPAGESQLKRLCSIRFVRLQPGRSLKSFRPNDSISFQTLKQYVEITDSGKLYLEQMARIGIEPQTLDY